MSIKSRRLLLGKGLKLTFGLLLFFTLFVTQASEEPGQPVQKSDAEMNFRLDTLVEKPTERSDSNSTADHTKFEELKGPFTSGPEVTKATPTFCEERE